MAEHKRATRNGDVSSHIAEHHGLSTANPPYGKRWRLYILPQYLANRTEPLAHTENYILAKFIPVLAKLCMQGLKFSDLFCAFL